MKLYSVITTVKEYSGCKNVIDTLRHALTRNGDGSPSGPLARVLDLLAGGI
jgi:hypothetical protein